VRAWGGPITRKKRYYAYVVRKTRDVGIRDCRLARCAPSEKHFSILEPLSVVFMRMKDNGVCEQRLGAVEDLRSRGRRRGRDLSTPAAREHSATLHPVFMGGAGCARAPRGTCELTGRSSFGACHVSIIGAHQAACVLAMVSFLRFGGVP
jgi:hypothetical protein